MLSPPVTVIPDVNHKLMESFIKLLDNTDINQHR